MTWLSLQQQDYKRLHINLAVIQSVKPKLFPDPQFLISIANEIEYQSTGDRISTARIRQRSFSLFDSETFKQGIAGVIENQADFIAVCGIGGYLSGAAVLLQQHPQAVLSLIEPDAGAWAVFLTFCDARELFSCERFFPFAGKNAGEEFFRIVVERHLSLKPLMVMNGCDPADQPFYTRYQNVVQQVVNKVQSQSGLMQDKMQETLKTLSVPLHSKPKAVWSCIQSNAYIHLPILRAALKGFEECGLEANCSVYEADCFSTYEKTGHFLHHPSDLFVFVNNPPADYLRTMGFVGKRLDELQRDRISLILDDIHVLSDTVQQSYQSAGHFERSGRDWIFCFDRTYMEKFKPCFKHVEFLPVAAIIEKPGTVREEYKAPVSYVGTLPDVLGYMKNFSSHTFEVIEKIEQLRSNDYSRRFVEFLHQLAPNQTVVEELQSAANLYCRDHNRQFEREESALELFLLYLATYFKRKRIALALLPFGLKVYGPNTWLDILPPDLKDRYGGFVKYENLADCYASSTITLNIHSHQCPTCLNQRDFDATMAGSVVLSDWVDDFNCGLLQPGEEILTFQNIEEAAELIQKSLSCAMDLDQIRINGQEKIHSRHLYKHRAAEILDRMQY